MNSIRKALELHKLENGTYTSLPGYPLIPANPSEATADGSPNAHERIVRDFYLHALSTAGVAVNRRESDVAAAEVADASARSMLVDLR